MDASSPSRVFAPVARGRRRRTHGVLLDTARHLGVIACHLISAACIGAGAIIIAVVVASVLIGCASPASRATGPGTQARQDVSVVDRGPVSERTVRIRIGGAGPGGHGAGSGGESGASGDGAADDRGDAGGGVGTGAQSMAAPRHWLVEVMAMPLCVQSSEAGEDAVVRAALEHARATGRPVEIELTESQTGAVVSRSDHATLDARGASLSTDNAEVAASFEAQSDRYTLPWSERRAGGGRTMISAALSGAGGVNSLHAIGGLCMLAAVVVLLVPPRSVTAAAVLGVGGLGIVAVGTVASEYPWMLAVAAVLFAAGLGYVVWVTLRARGRGLALDAITPAVEASTDTELKPRIRERAGGAISAVRAEVRRAKKRVGV